MEDFNNIEHDPIPEGLEFNESYMQEAFVMYDAAKQKRKRRLIIWWLTSSTGLAAILLVGLIYWNNDSPKHANGKNLSPLAKPTYATIKATLEHQTPLKKSSSSIQNEEDYNNQITNSDKQNKALKKDAKREKQLLNQPKKTRQAKQETVVKYTVKKQKTFNHLSRKKGGDTLIDHSNENSVLLSERPIGKSILGALMNMHQSFDSLISKSIIAQPIDSSTALSNNNHPHEVPIDFRKHQLYMNLGVNTLFGMKELQQRVTFRESIGISYHNQNRPKWSIGAGFEYHSISRISYKRKVGDTLNVDNTTTILNKTTLNYIGFSPEVRYQLGAKHQFTAGLGIDYLLTDPGERYEIQNYTDEEPKRSSSQLYYSTFNRFNFSASLGYSYQFSKFMSAHALYHFGFTDITKNNGLNTTMDRNSRLQFVLKIRLY